MADSPRQHLRRTLDLPPQAEWPDRLDDRACRKLMADLEDAQAREREALRAAMEQALSHVPRLLRGPIKTLFGL